MGAYEDPTSEAFTAKRKAAEAHAHNYSLYRVEDLTIHWICPCGSQMTTRYQGL